MSLGDGFRQTSLFAPTMVFFHGSPRAGAPPAHCLTPLPACLVARPSSTDPKSMGCLTERCHAVAELLAVDGDGSGGVGVGCLARSVNNI